MQRRSDKAEKQGSKRDLTRMKRGELPRELVTREVSSSMGSFMERIRIPMKGDPQLRRCVEETKGQVLMSQVQACLLSALYWQRVVRDDL